MRTNEGINEVNKFEDVDFGFVINGQKIVVNLNPGKIKGEQTAYEFSTTIYAENGLYINFIPKNGGIVGMNGLKIRKTK